MAGPNYGMPQTHRYTQADLYPTLRDPRCSPDFPLATYWPVYLGNFWCDVYQQHATRIQEYFASKGLLVRMVFGRNQYCDPFFAEQSRCQCYDFLVYFVAQQDAQDAVYYCNRDMYYGHRLNVLSGRTPEFFDLSKSCKQSLVQPGKLAMSEQTFERHIYNICHARMRCIFKHSKQDLLVEYCSTNDRTMALKYCKVAAPQLISMNQPKQRFLERDVQRELMQWIQHSPTFMNMLPPGNIMQALTNGLIPQSTMTWKTLNKVPNIGKIRAYGPRHKRRGLREPIYVQAKQLFGVDVDKTELFSEDARMAKQQRRMDAKIDMLLG